MRCAHRVACLSSIGIQRAPRTRRTPTRRSSRAAASGSGAERFAAGDWYDLAGGGKALRSAQAVAACRAAQRLPWATHFIYIAEIQSVELAAQASTLVYFGGGFHPLAAD